MNKYIHVNPDYWKKRWLVYLDLLGSSKKALTESLPIVFNHYAHAISAFRDGLYFETTLEKVWFSDTFIIYSQDDSAPSFSEIHGVTHIFVDRLLRYGIPVCGAMSCDYFYADQENSLYFGKALIDAYGLSENINYIKYILTRSAEQRMIEISLPIEERLNYAYFKVPYKANKGNWPEKLPAYIVGSSGTINGQPIGISELKGLMSRAESQAVKEKYKNTIEFSEKHQRHQRTVPAK